MAMIDDLMTKVAALLDRVSALLGRRDLSQAEFANWLGGAANGGPNGDGIYPLTDSTGFVRMVACLEKQMENGIGGGLDAEGVAALLNAAIADGGAGFQFLGVAPDGTPKRFAPNIVPNPIADLPRVTEALANDLVEISRNGARCGLPFSALTKLTTGKVNVKEAPYNCKGDYREVRDAVVLQYSNTLRSASNPWVAADVGKLIFIGNKGAGLNTMPRMITGFVSAGEITFGPAVTDGTGPASYGASNLVAGWGTDDTAGMRLALLAAAPLAGTKNVFGGVVELPPGFYLCDNLYLPTKTAMFGYGPRQSVIVRKPSASTLPTISNQNTSDDFPVLITIGIYGLKSLQTGVQRGYLYAATAGFGTYEYVDPYPHWHGMHFWETSGDAMVHAGQGNGIMTDVNIANPAGCGFKSAGYDMDIANLYVIAARNAAIFMDSGAANNNVSNGKFSYSGGNAFSQTADGFDVGCLVYLGYESSGNCFDNCRAQESFLSCWAIGGKNNNLSACKAEDVGNVSYGPTVQPADKARAAVQMLPGAIDCTIDMHASFAIPNSAPKCKYTHALFVSNPTKGAASSPTYNEIKIRTIHTMRVDTDFSNGFTSSDGRAVPPTTGAYSRALYGTDDPAGISALNDDIRINRTEVI